MTDDLETTTSDVRAATEPPGEDDVAFEAPWQARAFVLTVALRRENDFPWAPFQRLLSDELADDSEGDVETAAAEAVESA